MPMLPKGVTNTTAVFAGDKDLHGPRVSPLFDVAVTSVAEGCSCWLSGLPSELLAAELTADEFESIHWFGSCFYNSMLRYVWAQRKRLSSPSLWDAKTLSMLAVLA